MEVKKMINRVIIVGRLTANPELRRTEQGLAICKFTLAVQRQKDGADFISCVAFNKSAELLCQYQVKGNQIGVEGRIQTSNYEKNGERVYRTDVIVDSVTFLTPKSQQNNTPQTQQQNTPYNATENAPTTQQYHTRVNNTYGQQNAPKTQWNGYLNDVDTFDIDDDPMPF